MKILFISLAQINSLEDKGIYQDLLRQFHINGHEVLVVSPLERKYKKSGFYLKKGRIKFLHVWIFNIQKCNLFEKLLSTLTVNFFYKRAIKNKITDQRFDLILYTTPPITLTNLISWLKKTTNSKTYLLLKDIFPQNAVDMGLMKHGSFIYSFFKRQEHRLYLLSDKIGCMSDANILYISKEFPYLKSKLELNPNSIEIVKKNQIKLNRDQVLYSLNIPSNTKVFLYGGNLGIPQGTIFLTEIIQRCKNIYPSAFFLIIGDGTDYDKLCNWFNNNKPSNAKLIKSIPKKQFDEICSICDIGLILLRKEFTIPNFPSRLLSYMENKMATLSITDSVSDIGPISEKYGFGKWSFYGDIDAALNQIEYLLENEERLKKMGDLGYEFLCSEFDVKKSYIKIINFINNSPL